MARSLPIFRGGMYFDRDPDGLSWGGGGGKGKEEGPRLGEFYVKDLQP